MEGGTQVQEKTTLLEGEYVVVSNEVRETRGTLFIEAQIREEIDVEPEVALQLEKDLEAEISKPDHHVQLGADLLADEYAAELLLGKFYRDCHLLRSLKVIEYSGPCLALTSYSSNDVHIKVHSYQLYHTRRSSEEVEGLPQGEVTLLPHVKFDGQWDALSFETDIKSDLIWMLTNMLRFSQASGRDPGDTSPLFLLYGPPGTGKTTLCQALAQKISIRLNSTYKKTVLIEIKAAALLSKYYSESARQVDKIFSTLQNMCEDNSKEFVCVLIDEVETIAISREASANGESQESLRATNAFLTGLDRTKQYPNIVFLCTSNMVGSLDAAFLDRCGLKHEIEPPCLISQYAILRGRIQRLIARGIILSAVEVPSYREAVTDSLLSSELPGSKILHILELIKAGLREEDELVSGRSLSQLPEQALLRYLRGEDCDLDVALNLIERYVKAENPKEETDLVTAEAESVLEEDSFSEMQGGLGKRMGGTLEEEDDIYQMLSSLRDVIEDGMKKRRKVSSKTAKELA